MDSLDAKLIAERARLVALLSGLANVPSARHRPNG